MNQVYLTPFKISKTKKPIVLTEVKKLISKLVKR